MLLLDANFEVIFGTEQVTNSEALGPMGRSEEPLFWQVALSPKLEMEDDLIQIYYHEEMQEEVYARIKKRLNFTGSHTRLSTKLANLKTPHTMKHKVTHNYFSAFGWDR